MLRFHHLAIGVAAITVALIVGCGTDTTPELVTSPNGPGRVTPETGSTPSQAAVPSSADGAPRDSDAGADPIAKFHSNHADWVGKAHNKAMDDFFALMIVEKDQPKEFCGRVVEFMSDPARTQGKASREQLHAMAERAVKATAVCRGYIGQGGSSMTHLVTRTPNITLAAIEGISAAANSLLDQAGYAVRNSATASDLASTLNSITAQADQLVESERELVYAGANVGQSSYEYWQAETQTQAQDVLNEYGPCLAEYSDVANAAYYCMGITLPAYSGEATAGPYPWPSSNPSVRRGGQIRFVSSTATESATELFHGAVVSPPPCSAYLNWRIIARYDYGGAVVGGFYNIPGGPGAIISGAITYGGSASAIESWAQFAGWAWCRARS